MTVLKLKSLRLSQEKLFMGSALLVNGGNYLYNVLVGRILGPEAFAEAALLVTLLLVISFLGMTFQLATTKFAVLLNGQQWQALRSKIRMYALWIGIVLGCVVALSAESLQAWFSTASPWMFVLFGLGIPLYFLMSIKRGEYQGNNALDKLSISYQSEMWSRLIITILLLMLIPYSPGVLVSAGILISFAFGFLPFEKGNRIRSVHITLSSENKRNLNHFLLLTAGPICLNGPHRAGGVFCSLDVCNAITAKSDPAAKERQTNSPCAFPVCDTHRFAGSDDSWSLPLLPRTDRYADVRGGLLAHCRAALAICAGYSSFCALEYICLLLFIAGSISSGNCLSPCRFAAIGIDHFLPRHAGRHRTDPDRKHVCTASSSGGVLLQEPKRSTTEILRCSVVDDFYE